MVVGLTIELIGAPRAATYTVDDGDVAGLIAAINATNATPGLDTIDLAVGGTYTLTGSYDGDNGLPPISDELILNGHGATIARSDTPGTPDFRIVLIAGGAVATFSEVTLENGRHSIGAGVLNHGAVTLVRSTLSGNAASLYGGGVYNQPGASLTVLSSTLSGNSADTFVPEGCHSCSYGGAINNWGTLVVANSTIAGNSTGFAGGAIYTNGAATLINNTIAGNSTINFAGGIMTDSGGSIAIANTIIAANFSSSIGQTNCAAIGPITSLGHNLSDDPRCVSFFNQSGDLNNIPAGLDPLGLQDHGGPTLTIALIPDSPAIEGGDDDICAAPPIDNLDQTGVTRPAGPHCDMGANEAPPADATPPTVTCASPDGLWHATDVSLLCTATEDGSGLANPVDASFTLSTNVAAGSETSNASTNSRVVCDVAGNCVTAGPVGGNKVDKRAPVIAIVGPTEVTYVLKQAVAAAFSCTDEGSGLVGCVGTVADGAAVATATPGNHVFTVSATDAVGNTTTATQTYAVRYNVCVEFDQTKSHKAGSTLPIKLSLCDAAGTNVSSGSVAVVATAVYLLSTNAPGPLEDSGNANPDNQFRFAGGRYIFNLSLKGFVQGTYALAFTAGADPTTHAVQFQVR
jgi:hypothetical protein